MAALKRIAKEMKKHNGGQLVKTFMFVRLEKPFFHVGFMQWAAYFCALTGLTLEKLRERLEKEFQETSYSSSNVADLVQVGRFIAFLKDYKG